MRKRILAGVATACFTIAAFATPAAAGSDHDDWPEDCPHNAVCFWKGKSFEGPMSVRYNPGPNCDVAPDWKIGSAINNLDHEVRLYWDDDCDDLVEVLHPGEWDKRVHAHSWI
ncbi:peptidase inhibitor family I36 protein [Glycomyces tarimensis]